MQRSVNITTPYPTPEETARIYGISKRRAKEIRKMVEENLATAVNFYKNGAGFASSGNGALHKKPKSRSSAALNGTGKRRSVKSQSDSRRKPKRGKAKTSH